MSAGLTTGGAWGGAWGGDPARKQAAIEAARTALAAAPVYASFPALAIAKPDEPASYSNVYCAAWGTADPAELEDRSGLPAPVLLLLSSTLASGEHWQGAPGNEQRRPQHVEAARGAPISLLEAIRPGADPVELARHYVVDLLGWMAGVRAPDGRGLTPEQRLLVRELAALHGSTGADASAYRALRRAATAATDGSNDELAAALLRFVESIAWPIDGLVAELPELAAQLNLELRSHLSPEPPNAEERAVLDAANGVFRALYERLQSDPTLDRKALLEQALASPEVVAKDDPGFQERIAHYDRVAAEAYIATALDLMTGALRKA